MSYTPRQYLNFNRTNFWYRYSSSFGITRPLILGCSTFGKLTRSWPAVPYGAYSFVYF